MKDLLTFIFYCIAGKERTRIDEADINPDKWYEIILTHKNGSSEKLNESATFAGIIKSFEQYVNTYRFDEINIAVYETGKHPKLLYQFFTNALIYEIIHDYFRHQEALENMRFVGKIVFQEDDRTIFKKAYYSYGEEAEIFIDEIAFRYFRYLTCYIPDNGEENNPEDGCAYNDFLDITGGNVTIARHLFDEVAWEYPSTLYEQWASTGALDELDTECDNKLAVYSYTHSGDFVHCNNCDKIMLLPTGADKCPSCYFEGALGWEDDGMQETTFSELNESGKYELITKNELKLSEYLSDEVLTGEFEICPDFNLHHRTTNHLGIIDNKGIKIYACLNCSVSTGTLRTGDLVSTFLDVIKDTSEYQRLIKTIPAHVFEDTDDIWWDNEGAALLMELFDVLDSYAPEGYVFGSLPGDGADFGFWKDDDE